MKARPGAPGKGLARDQWPRSFQLFCRAQDELTSLTSGTGVGLVLVTALATQIEAQMHLQNHTPGAEFQLVMPMIDGG
jgi:K+-sensing histidine kinase KdpD